MTLSAVLEELEAACGQDVDHIFEKRFSGDFRMGLKVLGNISQVKYPERLRLSICSVIVYLSFLWICGVTAQCIQSPYAYLAKRLTNTKVTWRPHRLERVLLCSNYHNISV